MVPKIVLFSGTLFHIFPNYPTPWPVIFKSSQFNRLLALLPAPPPPSVPRPEHAFARLASLELVAKLVLQDSGVLNANPAPRDAPNVAKESLELVFVSRPPFQKAPPQLATAQTVSAPARPAPALPVGPRLRARTVPNATRARTGSSSPIAETAKPADPVAASAQLRLARAHSATRASSSTLSSPRPVVSRTNAPTVSSRRELAALSAMPLALRAVALLPLIA